METVMTYAEWEKRSSIRRKRNRKRIMRYYKRILPQKLCGLALIIMCVAFAPEFANDNGSGIVLGIALGAFLLLTRDVLFKR